MQRHQPAHNTKTGLVRQGLHSRTFLSLRLGSNTIFPNRERENERAGQRAGQRSDGDRDGDRDRDRDRETTHTHSHTHSFTVFLLGSPHLVSPPPPPPSWLRLGSNPASPLVPFLQKLEMPSLYTAHQSARMIARYGTRRGGGEARKWCVRKWEGWREGVVREGGRGVKGRHEANGDRKCWCKETPRIAAMIHTR